ncbi:MAG: POTRA domain-containing protein [Geodermatophilaceae bacterium]
MKLNVNGPLDEDAVGTARQDIIDSYRAKGFNDVDVQYRTDTNRARGTSRVVFTITEGPKGAINDIRFDGNTAFSDRILRKQMKTKRKTIIAFLDKSGRLDEAQLQQDLDAVREWYQDHGYVDVEVGNARRERTNGRLAIVVPITEGTNVPRRPY